jgi:VanZ family protein
LLRFLEKRKVQLVYTPLVIYWIVLLSATSFPTTSLPSIGISDKVMHFTAYFILGVLLNLTLIFQSKYNLLRQKNSLYTLLFGSIYAIIDEVHQHFIPGRFMEFMDFTADFLGLVLAVILVLSLIKFSSFSLNKIS